MSIRITAVRLTGGQTHQHITRLWWTNPANGKTGENARADIVSWIENENGKAYVEAGGHRVDVGVVTRCRDADWVHHGEGHPIALSLTVLRNGPFST